MDSLLLLVLVLLYTFQSFFCKLYTTACKVEKSATPVFNALFGGVIGLVTLAIYGFQFHPSALTWIFGLVNAVLLFLYNTALIGASKRGSYAFLNLCMLFGGILVPLFVSLISGASFTLLQLIGILVMLLSFVIINAKGISLKGSQGAYYLFCILLFLSNGFFGVVMDAQQLAMKGSERGEMIVISYLGTTVLSLLYILVTQRKEFLPSFKVGAKALCFGLGSGAVAVAAVNLLMFLLNRIQPATILYTIDNGGVLVASAVFAAVFLKEKIAAHQAAGYVLSLLSIVLLSL